LKIYNIVKAEDGSVKIESELTAEETQFMLEFALNNLVAFGFVPNSLSKYFTKEEQQKAFLEEVSIEDLPKA
jgi:hypothetical protein